MTDVLEQERSKYEQIWELPEYSNVSPGEKLLLPFLLIVKPKRGSTIVDYGAGCGRVDLEFVDMGYSVKLFDIASNCLDAAVKERLSDVFTEGCLWSSQLPTGDVGYCCDVMEHIPTEYVPATIKNILNSCKKCFFSIALIDDIYGKAINQPLHLTVKPFVWWRDLLGTYGEVVEARDLLDYAIFVVQQSQLN